MSSTTHLAHGLLCSVWILFTFQRQLVEFKHKTRNRNVPTNNKPSLALGKWIASQRIKYRTGQLAKEKIKQLEGIGFIW
jgi:hypothetical protein